MNYERIYESLIEKAKNRVPPEGYIERHHIIPRCLGGEDAEDNLVALTPEEHYLAHQMLVKIHPDEGSLIYAANKMCVGHKGRRNNKRYGWLKRRYSEQRKKDSKGKGNNQYGTMWINKIGTTENRKIKKDESIPEGWKRGRAIKSSTVTKRRRERSNKSRKERANYARKKYEDFLNSDCSTLMEFVEAGGYDKSFQSLSRMFRYHIPEYNKRSKQGIRYK